MQKANTGIVRRLMASICHRCPICIYGRRAPRSLIGRILHHPLHADHCPFWKAEKELFEGQTGSK